MLLTIFLRQQGSPESKPVHAPHSSDREADAHLTHLVDASAQLLACELREPVPTTRQQLAPLRCGKLGGHKVVQNVHELRQSRSPLDTPG